MTRFPPYKFVRVEWCDSSSPGATDIYDATDLKDAHAPMTVVTCGWLLADDKTGVTVASEWFAGTTDFRGLTCILRPNIVEWVELGVKAAKRRRKVPVVAAPE